MNRLLRMLLSVGPIWLLNRYRRASLDLVRIEGALCYVKGVRCARRAFLAGVAALGALGLLASGFVILHAGLFLLLYLAYGAGRVLAAALLVLGLVYTLVPLAVLVRLGSQGAWMRFFKADRLVRQAVQDP